jgi:endonuclease YncB( thermonuclease family)
VLPLHPLICASLYITDGDTIWCDREKIRLMDFDAPETQQAKCEGELAAGYEAKARLLLLLRSGSLTVYRYGRDKYGRTLGRLGHWRKLLLVAAETIVPLTSERQRD